MNRKYAEASAEIDCCLFGRSLVFSTANDTKKKSNKRLSNVVFSCGLNLKNNDSSHWPSSAAKFSLYCSPIT